VKEKSKQHKFFDRNGVTRLACLLCFAAFLGGAIRFFLISLLRYQDAFGYPHLYWGETVTLISLSPDASMRVVIVDRGQLPFGERNLELRLQRKGQKAETIYETADREVTVGSERIIWLSDNSQFILLSRRFPRQVQGYKEVYSFKNGEFIDLLYNVQEKRAYECYDPNLDDQTQQIADCSIIPRDTLKRFQNEFLLWK
jgi:hypothetical protein